MKIEKNGRAYWMNRFNKVSGIGSGLVLLSILEYINKRRLEAVVIYLISGAVFLGYGLLCKKRAKEAENRNNKKTNTSKYEKQ